MASDAPGRSERTNDLSVLIAEDEAIIAMYLERLLRALGYRPVGRAATPAEAIARADQLRPDVVLMDVRLRGGTSGIEAAAAIWRDFRIPVVFATAHTDSTTMEELAAVSPFPTVKKPYDQRDIDEALQATQLGAAG